MAIWQVIQESEHAGNFNKEEFIQYVTNMPQQEFNRFCREYLHLLHFYDTNVNSYASDQKAFIQEHIHHFWQMKPFDADKQVGSEE
jgi:hypothetical protein